MSPASKDVGPFFILPWSLLGPVKGTKRPKTAPETDKPAAVRRYRVGKDLNGKMGEQKGRGGEARGTAGGSRRVPPRLSPRALPAAPLTVSQSSLSFRSYRPDFAPVCAFLPHSMLGLTWLSKPSTGPLIGAPGGSWIAPGPPGDWGRRTRGHPGERNEVERASLDRQNNN